MKKNKMSFPRELIKLVEDRGLNQHSPEWVQIGITGKTVYNLCKGISRPTLKNLDLLSRFFNVSLGFLVYGTEQNDINNVLKKENDQLKKIIELKEKEIEALKSISNF